jgi:hypothetical protein
MLIFKRIHRPSIENKMLYEDTLMYPRQTCMLSRCPGRKNGA